MNNSNTNIDLIEDRELVSEVRNSSTPKKEKDEVQITISLDCDERLQKELHRINMNFDFSRVTRKHLVVYIVNKALSEFTEDDVQAVRQSTLTDQALFDKLSRDIRESGAIPKEIRDFLWKSLNLTQSPRKTKKTTHLKHSNAIPENEEAA